MKTPAVGDQVKISYTWKGPGSGVGGEAREYTGTVAKVGHKWVEVVLQGEIFRMDKNYTAHPERAGMVFTPIAKG